MDRLRKYVEVGSNIAILIVCALIAYVAITRFILPKPHDNSISGPTVGSKLNIPEFDLGQKKQGIVLAISTQCHFCTESMPFYSQLVASAQARGTAVIAVLPQAIDESHVYLNAHGLNIQNIKQMQLDRIGVSATPTILLIRGAGLIEGVWVGKLPATSQAEVLARIH
jgi:hypothetical protein